MAAQTTEDCFYYIFYILTFLQLSKLANDRVFNPVILQQGEMQLALCYFVHGSGTATANGDG